MPGASGVPVEAVCERLPNAYVVERSDDRLKPMYDVLSVAAGTDDSIGEVGDDASRARR